MPSYGFVSNVLQSQFSTYIFLVYFFHFFLKYEWYKDSISHLKGLIMGILILEGQMRGISRDRISSLFVKKQTFQEKRAWQALEAATPLSFWNFVVNNQTLKMRYCRSLYHSRFLSNFSFKLEVVNFCGFTL